MQMQPQTGTAPGLRNERGVTMALALFALVVIGTFVSGAFFRRSGPPRRVPRSLSHPGTAGPSIIWR
jgi:hypothetical protein